MKSFKQFLRESMCEYVNPDEARLIVCNAFDKGKEVPLKYMATAPKSKYAENQAGQIKEVTNLQSIN